MYSTKMKNLSKKIINFINDDNHDTLIIDFSILNAQLYEKVGEPKKPNKDLPKYSVYIVKGHFLGTLTFWFIDGGNFVLSIVIDMYSITLNEKTDKILIKEFIRIETDPAKGNELVIDENSLKVSALIKGNRNILDYKTLVQYYFEPLKYTLKEEAVDVEKVINTNLSNQNCYIATLAYGDINHPKVEFLRYYRDNKLNKTIIGKFFVKTYYATSPYIVRYLKDKNKINKTIKNILDYIITKINK